MSQFCVAWFALTPSLASAAEANAGRSDREARAEDGSANPAKDPRSYRVALGGSLSAGGAGWGTELGHIWELNARAQLLPWLGAGASFFELVAPNNESFPAFHAQAVALHAAVHPLPKFIIDPFLRADGLYFVGVQTTGFDAEPSTRLGLEGRVGVNLTLPHFALGLHLRHGIASKSWTMLGLQLEGRL